jgi:succinate dehydrogenase / fumarate reductase cytochrome b subunit
MPNFAQILEQKTFFKYNDMAWISTFLHSSIGRKVLMAITGLFLCSFLLIHMSGNFLLFKNDNGLEFNAYAQFMTHFPLIKFVSYITYASFILHAIDGLMLAAQNRQARPAKYAVTPTSSTWASRNMAILGTIILVFLVIHMKSFWFEMHFGSIGTDSNGNKDLYTIVVAAFSQWWYVAFYLVSLVALSYHLLHGFQSGFQTLGLNHSKYTPLIKTIGFLVGVLIPLGFAAQPVYVFLKSAGIL